MMQNSRGPAKPVFEHSGKDLLLTVLELNPVVNSALFYRLGARHAGEGVQYILNYTVQWKNSQVLSFDLQGYEISTILSLFWLGGGLMMFLWCEQGHAGQVRVPRQHPGDARHGCGCRLRPAAQSAPEDPPGRTPETAAAFKSFTGFTGKP